LSNIVILGGSIEGLILSILSTKQHNVTLIDIHPEIGFPCTIPGWVENLEVLHKYLSDDEIKQLNVFQNTNGFAISGEWLFKLLTIKAARSGVNILVRCRVTKVNYSDGKTTVQFFGGNNGGEGEICCDNLFDLTDFSAIAPGNLQHKHTKSSPQTKQRKKVQHWGGIALSKDCQNNSTEPILQLIRNDGLCELWYEHKPTWTPTSGWIEMMKNTAPKPINDMSIDNSITYGEHLFHSINHH
jgi:hypothetical protein